MIPLFRSDPYLSAHETIVDNVTDDGQFQLLSFRETLFTQGGGQPRDFGTVIYNGQHRAVEDLVKHKGDIRIRIVAIPDLKKGEAIRCELDVERRLRIMRLHTAQHALAGALRRIREDYQTAGMQISDDAETCEMKFRTSGECSESDILRGIGTVADAVREGREVRAESFESVDAAIEKYGMLYRAGDPSVNIKGKVRVIVIAGLDVNACGGTHVRNISEIGGIRLVALEGSEEERRVRFALIEGEKSAH